MINKSRAFAVVTLAAIANADKSTLDYLVPFDFQKSEEFVRTDIDGNTIMGEDGKPMMDKAKPLGVILRQTGSAWNGAKVFPFYCTNPQVAATKYPSVQAENQGQMVPGCKFHLRGYDFNLEAHPEVEELYDQNGDGTWDISKLQEFFADYDLKKLTDEKYLIIRDMESGDPVAEISTSNYYGAPQGNPANSQRGKDVINLIPNSGCVTYLADTKDKVTGAARQQEVPDWGAMGNVNKRLAEIWTRHFWMKIDEDTKNALATIFKTQDEGGYIPYTSNAPSQVAKRAMAGVNVGFAPSSPVTPSGIPDATVGINMLSEVEEVEEEVEEVEEGTETTKAETDLAAV